MPYTFILYVFIRTLFFFIRTPHSLLLRTSAQKGLRFLTAIILFEEFVIHLNNEIN